MTRTTSDEAATPEAILEDATHRMFQSLEFLKRDLNTVRTGRATPALVDNLMVEYYGTLTPLNQLASVSAPEAQLILIQPWDKQSIQDIERSIMKSPLNLNPSNDGSIIRLPIPPLSQERRQELVKTLGKTVEQGKIAVRNVRRDAQDKLRALERIKTISQDENQRAQTSLQKTTNTHTAEIDRFWNSKVEEMMKL